MLKSITPANLKKYGMYAMLSFFMSTTIYLVIDDRRRENTDLTYERQQKDKVQKMLDEQRNIRLEQEHLLKDTSKKK